MSRILIVACACGGFGHAFADDKIPERELAVGARGVISKSTGRETDSGAAVMAHGHIFTGDRQDNVEVTLDASLGEMGGSRQLIGELKPRIESNATSGGPLQFVVAPLNIDVTPRFATLSIIGLGLMKPSKDGKTSAGFILDPMDVHWDRANGAAGLSPLARFEIRHQLSDAFSMHADAKAGLLFDFTQGGIPQPGQYEFTGLGNVVGAGLGANLDVGPVVLSAGVEGDRQDAKVVTGDTVGRPVQSDAVVNVVTAGVGAQLKF